MMNENPFTTTPNPTIAPAVTTSTNTFATPSMSNVQTATSDDSVSTTATTTKPLPSHNSVPPVYHNNTQNNGDTSLLTKANNAMQSGE